MIWAWRGLDVPFAALLLERELNGMEESMVHGCPGGTAMVHRGKEPDPVLLTLVLTSSNPS